MTDGGGTANHGSRGPLLLTPGPLTTSATVKQAMVRDWGSRDDGFIALTRSVRDTLTGLAGGRGTHTTVPLQGSGTFAVEAMLGTFVPPNGAVLVAANGQYGRRMAEICGRIGRTVMVDEVPFHRPLDADAIGRRLDADPAIGHVAVVHCETTTGILNPLEDIAAVVAQHGRRLLVDGMSAFGALPVDAAVVPFDALAASANKCLQGVPGLGFVICREAALSDAAGNAPSLSLDLHDQWRGFEANGQWRFTPPTQVLASLAQALQELANEGGPPGRLDRYRQSCAVLTDGMAALGFRPYLAPAVQAPIIVTFHMPGHPRFEFDRFYGGLKDRGFVIYPGKLTNEATFRVGCIGDVNADDMRAFLAAVTAVLTADGIDLRVGVR